ncbi:MAG TPA: VOC family protein [Mycobacterium sp.]|nr:VOC family protein [Mycobacterium sp.]
MHSPTKFSHVVLQTNKLPEMRNWYNNVLGAKTAFENEAFCFLSYDEEHHRIGLASLDNYSAHNENAVGMHHMSFTYATLESLLETFERLTAEGIEPAWLVNHGATISMYYLDPEGNRIELQFDVFATNEEANDFINGPIYQKNPVGVEFDARQMLADLRSGVPVSELTRRTS